MPLMAGHEWLPWSSATDTAHAMEVYTARSQDKARLEVLAF
jgi:hypothetical protein